MITQSKHIGELDKRMTFRTQSTSDDGMGGKTVSGTSDIITTWVSIRPTSGQERLSQGAIQSNITHKIVARYREDLDSNGYSNSTYDNNLQGVYNSRIFNIKHVRNMEENDRFVVMEATEEDGDEA